jgi:hypothetical protein
LAVVFAGAGVFEAIIFRNTSMKPFCWLSRNWFAPTLAAILFGSILLSRFERVGSPPNGNKLPDRIFQDFREQFTEEEARALYGNCKRAVERWRNHDEPDMQQLANFHQRLMAEIEEAYPIGAIGE